MPERCERRGSLAVARGGASGGALSSASDRRRVPSAMREQLQKERTDA